MIKYHYAYNEHGEEIDISIVTKEYRKEHVFRCSYCGAPMIARLGDNNAAHFAHSVDCEDCGNGESDLHKYAKRAIRNMFYTSEAFIVGIPQRVKCGAKNCVFRIENNEYEECSREQIVDYDLKEWGYDTCEEEQFVGDFKADLLLTSSKELNRPPILIEIAVTNPCKEEKKNSSLRIIEVPIKSFEDVSRFLKEGFRASDPYEYSKRMLRKAPSFYGFAKTTKSEKAFSLRSLMTASIWRDGFVETSYPEDRIECSTIDDLCVEEDAFEVAIDIPGGYLYYRDAQNYIRVIAIDRGFLFAGAEKYSLAWRDRIKEQMIRDGVVYEILPHNNS